MVQQPSLSEIVERVVACWNKVLKGAAGVYFSGGLYYGLIVFGHISSLMFLCVNLSTAARVFFGAIAGAFAENGTYNLG